jgi:hypothetical protein
MNKMNLSYINKMANLKKQKGISIVLIVLIVSFIFAIALGINSISYQQAKTMNSLGLSVVAFFAADAGAEKQLYSLFKEDPVTLSFTDQVFAASFRAAYTTSVTCQDNDPSLCFVGASAQPITPDPNCDADNFCVKSVGSYQGIRRAIELQY